MTHQPLIPLQEFLQQQILSDPQQQENVPYEEIAVKEHFIPRYESPADVNMRLNRSYLRYEDDWYYCEQGEGISVVLYRIERGRYSKVHNVSANDDRLHIESPPLGYCNLEDYGAVYLTRTPARRQKQGVDTHNLSGFDERTRRWLHSVGRNLVIDGQDIKNMLIGIYPTPKECFEKFKDSQHQYPIAFSRRFCLSPVTPRLVKIKYLSQMIGILNMTKSGTSWKPTIYDSYKEDPVINKMLNEL